MEEQDRKLIASRTSVFQLGTIAEWVTLIILVVGGLWAASGFVNEIKNENQTLRFETQQDVAAIKNSINEIKVTLDTSQRILKLEQAQLLNEINNQTTSLMEQVSTNNKRWSEVWVRLRAIDTNIQILKREVERAHPEANIVLKEPGV